MLGLCTRRAQGLRPRTEKRMRKNTFQKLAASLSNKQQNSSALGGTSFATLIWSKKGRRRQLYSVRELRGLLIHEALASVVRRVADGGRVSDEGGVAEEARRQLLEIVPRSLATSPGELQEGRQLAETFNGVIPEDDIRH